MPSSDPSPPSEPVPSDSGSGSGSTIPISALGQPTSLSCRDLFDRAFFCQSPGGQFLSVYRHKQLRACTGLWDDLRFCMSHKYSYAPYAGATAAEDAIAARFAKREFDTYRAPGKRSSDDVWQERTLAERLERAWDKIPPAEMTS